MRHVPTCYSRWHTGQGDHAAKQFQGLSPLFSFISVRFMQTLENNLIIQVDSDLSRSPLAGFYPQFTLILGRTPPRLAVYATEKSLRCPVNPTSNAATALGRARRAYAALARVSSLYTAGALFLFRHIRQGALFLDEMKSKQQE
jgi:hypothetical protein